jgi:hypothetical protein
MTTLDTSISHISKAFAECRLELLAFLEDQGQDQGEADSTKHKNTRLKNEESPAVLMDATNNLLDLLYIQEGDSSSLSTKELSELGDYGLDMLHRLAENTQAQGFGSYQNFETLAYPLALWLARQGAEISILYPIVSTLARMANRLTEPEQLEQLFLQTGEIIEALSVKLTQDLEQSEPGSPLSVLLINRAIVATRSLNLDFITFSYQVVREQLPELANGFYAEAMEQMELLNYPPEVRALVEDFYTHAKGNALLH